MTLRYADRLFYVLRLSNSICRRAGGVLRTGFIGCRWLRGRRRSLVLGQRSGGRGRQPKRRHATRQGRRRNGSTDHHHGQRDNHDGHARRQLVGCSARRAAGGRPADGRHGRLRGHGEGGQSARTCPPTTSRSPRARTTSSCTREARSSSTTRPNRGASRAWAASTTSSSDRCATSWAQATCR